MKNIVGVLFWMVCVSAFAQVSIHLPDETIVEGGSFYVGTDFGEQDYIGNTNASTPSFLIMNTEVPYRLYRDVQIWALQHGYSLGDACNGATIDGCRTNDRDNGQHPAVNVTWWDALLFANALSEHQELAPYYLNTDGSPLKAIPQSQDSADINKDPSASGYRLPDMAEWQVVARGGNVGLKNGSYGYPHSGSAQSDTVTNFPSEDGTVSGTLRLGSKRSNALGLYDMSGNAAEWIDERNHYALGVPLYYFCGGSFQQAVNNVLSGCDVHSPNFSLPDIGFRLIRATHD